MPLPYAGARGRLTLADVTQLGEGHRLQPKLDGSYAQLHLDGAGRIFAAYARSGRRYSSDLLGDLIGCQVGHPGDVLIGELEAHTEAGVRMAQTRGWRNVHIFDALRLQSRDVAPLPHRDRRDLLWRSRVSLPDVSGWGEGYDRGRVRGADGRYRPSVPRGWRRCPIVEEWPVSHAGRLWERVESGEAEGLVVVAQAAPIGARRAKSKVKPSRLHDCRVLVVEPRRLLLDWHGTPIRVGRGTWDLEPGDIVELKADGYYEGSGLPRFPRVVRYRADLSECGECGGRLAANRCTCDLDTVARGAMLELQ
jgi:hypothetical protein